MDYIKLAKVSDFDTVRIRSYRVIARNVGIVKDSDGTFFATEVSCKHQNADLITGRFRGDVVTCPRHGWTYDIRTGQCLNHDSTPLRRYGLRIEGDDIFVSITPVADEASDWDEKDLGGVFPSVPERRDPADGKHQGKDGPEGQR